MDLVPLLGELGIVEPKLTLHTFKIELSPSCNAMRIQARWGEIAGVYATTNRRQCAFGACCLAGGVKLDLKGVG